MQHCDACPFRTDSLDCYAATSNNPRLCQLANDPDRDDYRELVARRTVDPNDPPPAPRIPRGPGLTDEAREQLRALRRVRKCEHRTAPECGCPSSPAKCSRDDRPDEVYLQTCVACQLGQLDQPGDGQGEDVEPPVEVPRRDPDRRPKARPAGPDRPSYPARPRRPREPIG